MCSVCACVCSYCCLPVYYALRLQADFDSARFVLVVVVYLPVASPQEYSYRAVRDHRAVITILFLVATVAVRYIVLFKQTFVTQYGMYMLCTHQNCGEKVRLPLFFFSRKKITTVGKQRDCHLENRKLFTNFVNGKKKKR